MQKKILVTGATGYIGEALIDRLLGAGHVVHALVRSMEKSGQLPPEVKQFAGDLFNTATLERAIEGVEEVYHVAAYARPWAADPATFYRINVDGALNIFNTAARQGVRRVVFTSTAGVFGPSPAAEPAHESMERKAPFFTDYEKSKAQAEAMIQQLAAAGQDIVIVNPSRVYGPGQLSVSNGVTRMVKLYLSGKFRFLPGDGNSIGNYVFIDDVVEGHLLAMERGVAGERYALGGENASYRAFFNQLRQISGVQNRLFPLPIGLMRLSAVLMKTRADWFGAPPLITPEWVDRFLVHWALSSGKAEQSLGYKPVPLEEGLRRTVAWLRNIQGA